MLSQASVCEKASIDEVYLDITEVSVVRLLKEFSFMVELLLEEVHKTHVQGLVEVHFWELNLL